MKECSVNLTERIYIKKEHLVCHTSCNKILKVRFKKYSIIRPEVSIKYFKWIVKRFGNYAIDKEVVRISKDSKIMLEKITGKELISIGILMKNMKTGVFAKMGFITDNRCACNECLEGEKRSLVIKECSTERYSLEDFKAIINLVKKAEKLKSKIKGQEILYNKYGIRRIRAIYERFFGCYSLKEKRAGVRPFTLKGPWSKESASKMIHSYKTSLSIKNMSFFILLHKTAQKSLHRPALSVMYNNTAVYYSVVIHQIDLKTKTDLQQHIKNKKHKK